MNLYKLGSLAFNFKLASRTSIKLISTNLACFSSDKFKEKEEAF